LRAVSRPLSLLAAVVALAFALAGCGGSSSKKSTDTSSSSAAAAPPASQTGCKKVAPAQPKSTKLPKPHGTLNPDRKWTVTMVTNCGTFSFELGVRDNPRTSASVAYLVRKHFYDGTSFHRIADGFVIQGGDPKGDGTGGPGYAVVEAPPGNAHYVRGTVAMAKTGTEPAGASGSQFFVVTGEDIGLPTDYAIAGQVTKGMGTVDRIAAVPHDSSIGPGDGKPSDPIVISKATLTSSP
jgi:cyclophilin family peptidyl-prolyl cis-trans isomerase